MYQNFLKSNPMNKNTNRRDFLNNSLKVGVLLILPYNGFSSAKLKKMPLEDPKVNEEIMLSG